MKNKQDMEKLYNYKIFETMHDKTTYWLVFDEENNVVYKTNKKENASNFIHTAQRAKGSH